jgi:DNA-binding NarL/FixJ family response regulator
VPAAGRLVPQHKANASHEDQIRGKSYKMVADALNITHDTVRHHIKNIYKKLEVHSVSEAILKTMKKKLI